MTTITIPLTKPVPGHNGDIREIILREPTWDDIMPVGHPYVNHTSSEGITIPVANPDAIQHYIEKCLVEPKHPLLLGKVCLVDTLRVRQAILDFFLNAEPEGAA